MAVYPDPDRDLVAIVSDLTGPTGDALRDRPVRRLGRARSHARNARSTPAIMEGYAPQAVTVALRVTSGRSRDAR